MVTTKTTASAAFAVLSLLLVAASLPWARNGFDPPPGFLVIFALVTTSFELVILISACYLSKQSQAAFRKKWLSYLLLAIIVTPIAFAGQIVAEERCLFRTGKGQHDLLLMPLWLNGDLREAVDMQGGSRSRAIRRYSASWVSERAHEQPFGIAASVTVLLVTYCATFCGLATILGIVFIIVNREAAPDTQWSNHFLKPSGSEHDIFISHSSVDAEFAKTVCEVLEAEHFRCWIAPRNIRPGEPWAKAIMKGIERSRVLVLILTDSSNYSEHVLREVAQAVSKRISLVTVKLSGGPISDELNYFVLTSHWLDGSGKSQPQVSAELVESIRWILLGAEAG